MLIHREHRYVVITPPKTGSHTLARLLSRPVFGAQEYASETHHNITIPADCAGFRVYLSVRHPLARAVSLYRWRHQEDWGDEPIYPFLDFCRELVSPLAKPFDATLVAWAGGLDLSGTIRLEHLREDLAALGPRGDYVIPHENIDPALRPPRWYYERTPEALPLALQWGAADMDRFGYSLDSDW